jgi:hypothetical protein
MGHNPPVSGLTVGFETFLGNFYQWILVFEFLSYYIGMHSLKLGI